MERSAAHSLVATYLRQRSEDLKSCEMVIELKGKRLKPRVIAVGVASNQQQLANNTAATTAADFADPYAKVGVSTNSFQARLYVFKEDATGKRLILHSSFELRRLESITEVEDDTNDDAKALGNTMDGRKSTLASKSEVAADIFDEDSLALVLDFKSASPMTFSFESEAQREAIASSLRRLIRVYGSIEQRQTILGERKLASTVTQKASFVAQQKKAAVTANAIEDLFGGGGDGEALRKAKIDELRQDKQHGFGASDQQLLMNEMSAVAAQLIRSQVGAKRAKANRHYDASSAVVRLFDSPHIFSEHLINKMQRTELRVIKEMISNDSVRSWETISAQAKQLGDEVASIQERMETYATHVAGSKDVIEEIEHSLINSQRREKNFSSLHEKMSFLQDTLSLKPKQNEIVESLIEIEDDHVVNFFLETGNSRILTEIIRHTDAVLHKGLLKSERNALAPPTDLPVNAAASVIAPSSKAVAIEEEFPVAAVIERKRYFVQLRRHVCRRAKLFAVSIVEAVFKQYFSGLESASRYSKNYKLVLRTHSELSGKLGTVSALTCAMQSVDPEGYMFLLRQYRTFMQRVYEREFVGFFDALRKCVKRLGWQLRSKNSGKRGESNEKGVEETLRGPSLLGNSNNKLKRGDVFAHWTETNETAFPGSAGEGINTTPRKTGTNSPNIKGASPLPTMPYGYHGIADSPIVYSNLEAFHETGGNQTPRGRSESIAGSDASKKNFTVQLPELHKANVRLHRSDHAKQGVASAAKAFHQTSVLSKGVDKVRGSDGGGFLRSDIAFGIALEAVIDIILYEEESLAHIFGLHAPYAGGPGGSSEASVAGNPPDRLVMPPHEISFHLQSTLRELFSGNALVTPSKGLRKPLSIERGEVDQIAPKSDAARRKLRFATMPSTDWRNFREDKEHHTSIPADQDVDSDEVSTEGVGTDSDDSNDEKESTAAKSNQSRKKILIRRNVVKEHLYRLTRKIVKSGDRIYVPAMLCMVEALLGINAKTNSESVSKAQSSYFCVNMLCKIHKKLTSAFDRHLREQTRSIVHCGHKFIESPEALLTCFAHLPLLIARLDATHDALDQITCAHYQHYDTLLLTLVDHCFDILDQLSHVKAIGSSSSTGVSLLTLPPLGGFLKQLTKIKHGDDNGADSAKSIGTTKEVKRGFLMQLRHNASFCYTYNALNTSSHAKDLLASRYERCCSIRDRYEELYLSRTIFSEEMPNFSRFINMCTELVAAYTLTDLEHSKALSKEKMSEVLSTLDKEVINGIHSSSTRIKRHFTRDVSLDSPEEIFHRQLLKSVWAHYIAMVKNKILFLNELLQWETFRSLRSTLSAEALETAIQEAA